MQSPACERQYCKPLAHQNLLITCVLTGWHCSLILLQISSFSLRTTLGLGLDDLMFLLPAGWRAVKDPLYLREAFEEWHATDPRVVLVLIGPALEAEGMQ